MCLQYLAPSTQQTTPQANLPAQPNLLAPVLPPSPSPADNTSTEHQGDPLIGGSVDEDDQEMQVEFKFSDPKDMVLPDL